FRMHRRHHPGFCCYRLRVCQWDIESRAVAACLLRKSDQWEILRGLGGGCHTLGLDSVVSDRARYYAIRIPSELRRAVAHADLYHGGRFLCRLLARARHAFLSALSENRHRRTCLNGDLALHDALRRYR